MANAQLPTIIPALLIGFIPIFFWIWFWLRNDEHPEPSFLLILTFITGGLLVFPIIPAQEYLHGFLGGSSHAIIFLAGIEEIAKFFVIVILVFGSRFVDEPIDYGVYLITGALGFSAMENVLYLLNPALIDSSIIATLTIGNSRFIGASVVHAVSAAIVGISLGVVFYRAKIVRVLFALFGLGGAITLHGLFNYFIMNSEKISTLGVLALLWVVGIIIVISFRRLAELTPAYYNYP